MQKTVPRHVNCTPLVRQYDILSNKWGVCYVKRNSKQKFKYDEALNKTNNYINVSVKANGDLR